MKKGKTKIKKSITGGFSLIEFLVAIGVFAILISIAVGGFVSAMRAQRAAVSMMAVNDSLAISLEQMARDFRTGFNFSKPSSDEITFINAKSQPVSYRFNTASSSIEKGIDDDNDPMTPMRYKTITAENVKISRLNFDLRHADADFYPPRVTISMTVGSAEPDVARLNILTDIQTTISVRCGAAGCPAAN